MAGMEKLAFDGEPTQREAGGEFGGVAPRFRFRHAFAAFRAGMNAVSGNQPLFRRDERDLIAGECGQVTVAGVKRRFDQEPARMRAVQQVDTAVFRSNGRF